MAALCLVGACGENASPSESPEVRFERLGAQVYQSYCVTCHQPRGQGLPNTYPPLIETEWVLGDKGRLIRLVLNGMQGPVDVAGDSYDNVMTPHGFLTDEQVAAVLTHVRQHFGNAAAGVTPAEVASIRATTTKKDLWDASELWTTTGIPEQ